MAFLKRRGSKKKEEIHSDPPSKSVASPRLYLLESNQQARSFSLESTQNPYLKARTHLDTRSHSLDANAASIFNRPPPLVDRRRSSEASDRRRSTETSANSIDVTSLISRLEKSKFNPRPSPRGSFQTSESSLSPCASPRGSLQKKESSPSPQRSPRSKRGSLQQHSTIGQGDSHLFEGQRLNRSREESLSEGPIVIPVTPRCSRDLNFDSYSTYANNDNDCFSDGEDDTPKWNTYRE